MKKPKICVPLTGKTREEINNQLDIIIPKHPDLIELRADFLENIENVEYVLSIIENIIEKTDIPLLFTIRSEREGGEPISLTEEEKMTLLNEVCANSDVTYIDYEIENDKKYILSISEITKEHDKKLIYSYHNFKETPTNDELLKKFILMELYGAHLAKIAVMPKNKEDVFRLLQLTKQADELLSIPVASMSMGDLGKYSRLMGWVYGSALTFGLGVESSAPGQIPIEDLQSVINKTELLIS